VAVALCVFYPLLDQAEHGSAIPGLR